MAGQTPRVFAGLRRARRLLSSAAVPTLDHEAPLAVLREDPALVPRLLRRAFGIAVPSYIDAAVADGSFNQAAPVERHAVIDGDVRADLRAA